LKKNILSMIIVVAIAVLLAGCSNGSNPLNDNTNDKSTASKQLIEPCQLISKAEAEELLGKALKEPEKTDNAVVGAKACFYDSVDETKGFLDLSLTQQAFMQNAEITPKYLFESIKENFEDELTKVDEIGDEAFIATPGIHILMGEYYIVIGVGNSGDETNRAILKAAGKKAVNNLELLINK